MGRWWSAGQQTPSEHRLPGHRFHVLTGGGPGSRGLANEPVLFAIGEESLTIFVDKRKLSRKTETAGNAPVVGGGGNSSAVSLETLHQLAASYFIDRESTLRRLHHIQIATGAIKVTAWEVLGEGGRTGGEKPRARLES